MKRIWHSLRRKTIWRLLQTGIWWWLNVFLCVFCSVCLFVCIIVCVCFILFFPFYYFFLIWFFHSSCTSKSVENVGIEYITQLTKDIVMVIGAIRMRHWSNGWQWKILNTRRPCVWLSVAGVWLIMAGVCVRRRINGLVAYLARFQSPPDAWSAEEWGRRTEPY